MSTYKKYTVTSDITKKARLLSLAGDETRIRILCLMFEYGEACVTDIAESLGTSVANISNHLQAMKDNGYFITERMGNQVCYRLVENEFTKHLKKVICE